MVMFVEQLMECFIGKDTKILGENLLQWRFVPYRSHN
jgi:hypothetical protein